MSDHISPELLSALLLVSATDRESALFALLPPEARGGDIAQLLSKLARLDSLEGDFAATLEREKLASLRELAYGASHEINNPLANISTRAQTLLRDETDPDRRKKLETINRQAFRAHEMIADMMLFAKPPDLKCRELDLSSVIRQVVGELMNDASEQGTALIMRGIDDPTMLVADENHFAVALTALCRNSLEAVSSAGQVTISVAENDESVTLRVSDNGPGIPPEVRRHLFDPFYSGREAGRGLGFGLSKCWRIVELHGGTIEVESEEGRGATFTIQLPRQPVSEESPGTMYVHG
ncbi:MAG: hypothetical protein CMJ64_18900 [Planctomycetaceae bacterium]|nr:hypothetical protein [Planctomycetaceae bacterium]